MDRKANLSRFGMRLMLSFALALVFVSLINEGSYIFLKDRAERAPQVVELVIPPGTSQEIAAGRSIASLPDKMTFVLGDTLVVRNEDQVDHQIGPVWVPPGRSASLKMERPEKYAYACSFQPSRYLGLDVRKPTTLATRLTALGLAVPPTTMFIFVYSLVLFPLAGKGRKTGLEAAPVPEDGMAQGVDG